MGMTMTEKILARAAARDTLKPGEVVLAKVDMISLEDGDANIDDFTRYGVKVWDPEKVVICFDHLFRSWMPVAATIAHPRYRKFAREQGIPRDNLYDIGRHGLSHQVPVEEGRVLPGTVSLTQDTQGATMGACNCFSIAALAETFGILLTGDVWMVVPECIQVQLQGEPPRGVSGKDIAYRLLRDLGDTIGGRVLEFSGPGVAALSIDARMGIANAAIQMGALTMIFPPDDRLLEYLTPRARAPFQPVVADEDAQYADVVQFDLSDFEYVVSGPHEVDLVRPLSELAGLEITAANISSCSSARLEDLTLAAEVMRGRTIDPRVRMTVTPISSRTMRQAMADGVLQVFADAGATVTTPGCGACYLGNESPLTLDDGERCISSSVENVPGRMGSTTAEIYLANPAVVAASAIEGRIADPNKYLSGTRMG